jgi:hypothetical protein
VPWLQPLGAIESAEITVECAEWHVSRLARHLEHQAIRKPQSWPLTKSLYRGRDSVWILQRQVFVIQEHLNRGRNRCRLSIVDGAENPRKLGKHKMRDPGTLCDKRVGGSHLPGIVAGDEPDQYIRINRAHVGS